MRYQTRGEDSEPKVLFEFAGDTLTGTVNGTFTGESQYGTWYGVEIQDNKGEDVVVFGSGKVLNDELARLDAVGYRGPVTITYDGEKVSKAGRRYKIWTVVTGDDQGEHRP